MEEEFIEVVEIPVVVATECKAMDSDAPNNETKFDITGKGDVPIYDSAMDSWLGGDDNELNPKDRKSVV